MNQSSATLSARPGLGYQPALDGLRAVSVVAVVLYHAGFGWMSGGFFGVEVFFVISGFLITSLLIDERVASGTNRLGEFWRRRARRLLPALLVMLLAVCCWSLLVGTAEQSAQLRRDLPWALLYSANLGQIVGDVPYFAHTDPPLLRHLWSLAVEEQWYVVWPLAFVALSRLGWHARRTAGFLIVVASAVFVSVWFVARGGSAPMTGPFWFDGADRVNVMYLSTVTRSAGLLIGAAFAFGWRCWRHRLGDARVAALDVLSAVSLAVLVACFVVGEVTSRATYPWSMALVSWTSAIAVLLTVHPDARLMRWALGGNTMAAIGRRSYGIYLWHWPVFVIAGATQGSWPRFIAASAIALAASELCYRYVELPVRRGALGALWARRRPLSLASGAIAGSVVAVMTVGFARVERFDVAAGGQVEQFVLAIPGQGSEQQVLEPMLPSKAPVTTAPPIDSAVAPTAAGSTTLPDTTSVATITAPTTSTTPTSSTTTTTLPSLPRSVTIVGDSQAHSLFVNLPRGIDDYFVFHDGAVNGCSVHEEGRVVTARRGFRNDFGICRGWADRWARSAVGSDVALVVLGAWDVFSIENDDRTIEFGSIQYDRVFTRLLGVGLDALSATGAQVALLEVPCMRPVDARGAAVPALPERGDDSRVDHINTLLRRVAARAPDRITFVEGPDAWCGDEVIATDVDYRWDGVHVYRRGADLVFETIAPALLAIPVDRVTEVTDG